jgi:hypothetical protein
VRVILLCFILTTLSVAFVAVDTRPTPESTVLKWAFVLIAVHTGPLGAFLYVLGCSEPMPGLHARYVAVRWRQVLGSTMHWLARIPRSELPRRAEFWFAMAIALFASGDCRLPDQLVAGRSPAQSR